jgi:hypothetical protein
LPEKDFRMVIFDGICEVWAVDSSGQGRFDTVE